MVCGEFFLIVCYFDCVRSFCFDVELGIGDDCVFFNIFEKQILVISIDMLVVGNYFFFDIDFVDLVYKVLVVNLSDLVVMGVDLVWLMLVLILLDVDEVWFEFFSDSLFDFFNYYDM